MASQWLDGSPALVLASCARLCERVRIAPRPRWKRSSAGMRPRRWRVALVGEPLLWSAPL
eukprot:62307-Prymnesium_polylepis.1